MEKYSDRRGQSPTGTKGGCGSNVERRAKRALGRVGTMAIPRSCAGTTGKHGTLSRTGYGGDLPYVAGKGF